jgi:hypothetical protein
MRIKVLRPEDADAFPLVATLRDALVQLVRAIDKAQDVVAQAREILANADADSATILFRPAAIDIASTPNWDPETRTLYLGQRIVKRYRVPSINQEAVLSAFQEEGWPRRIDDPLPCRAGLKAKYRLHFTIRRLNQCERERLIRFFGDGTGEGVCWESTEVSSSVFGLLGTQRRAA